MLRTAARITSLPFLRHSLPTTTTTTAPPNPRHWQRFHHTPPPQDPTTAWRMSIFNTSRLESATVLVTGASGGIGAATAILFARAGANVIVTARRAEKLAEVKEEALRANKEGGTGKGGRVETVVLDMQDKQGVEGFLGKLPEGLKEIDVLVNNAGLVFGRDPVGELNFDEVEVMLNTNVTGLFRLTNAIVPGMKSRGKGHIINLGSIAGREPYVGAQSSSCATKHALNGFNGALLRELHDTPLRVTEIQPGMVETEFSVTRFRGDKSAADKVYEGLKPLVASDIAEEIVWCAARPAHVQIAELFVMPTNQGSATLAYRGK